MNRRSADRIIVKSNDRMKLVIDWFYENKDWLDREEFRAPMERGVVELQEEAIEFTFENKNGGVELAVYAMEKPNLPAVLTFQYSPQTREITERRFADHLSQERRGMLALVLGFDRTDWKEALKYHALMQFMTHYREVIEVEEKNVKPVPKAKKRNTKRRPQPLIRRTYIVGEFDKDALAKPDGVKRRYTKPEHEVSVRGFLRHYKSGKTVWVKPCVRYKGQTPQYKEYEL